MSGDDGGRKVQIIRLQDYRVARALLFVPNCIAVRA
jgi:hypothetical protein